MTVSVPLELEFISDGDGVTTTFPYPVRFLEKKEIVVAFHDANGTESIKGLDVDYSIPGTSWPNGGSIVFTSAPPIGVKVVRYRQTQPKQVVDLENKAKNAAPSVEQQLDRLAMVDQDNGRQISEFYLRAARFPPGYSGNNFLPYPNPNKLLGWNNTGTGIVNKDIVSTGNIVAGAAGLTLIGKDTVTDIQDYLGIDERLKTGDDPIVVIATGQSNMLAVSGSNGGDRSTEPGVYVWEQIPSLPGQTKGWKEAGPDSPDWPWINGAISNAGIAYSFCRRLRRETKRKVYLIMHAAGGQAVEEWIGAGGMRVGLLAAIRDAAASPELAWRATVPLADYFLWHQGEADADYTGTTGAQWLARFQSVIADLRSQQPTFDNVWPLRAETKILVGELFRNGTNGGAPGVGSPTDDRNTEIRLFQHGLDPYITSVSSHTYRSADNLHISARDLDDFGGQRYYEAAMRLPKPTVPAPDYVSPTVTTIFDKVVLLTGSVSVNATTFQDITLPVTMRDALYVPTVTLSVSGASSTSMPKVINRTTTGFRIDNPTAVNMTVSWQVIGVKA